MTGMWACTACANMTNALRVPAHPRAPMSPFSRHTVCYDDGEVGMHRLWQHDERIKVLSPVAHWPRDAAIVRERLGAAHAELHSRKRQRREVSKVGRGPHVRRCPAGGKCVGSSWGLVVRGLSGQLCPTGSGMLWL